MLTPFGEVKQGLVQTYREGYKKRGISLEICENDWEHTKRATQACISHLIGSPNRITDKKSFPLMGFGHDWIEWDMPDYTPGCKISPEEKKRLEAESLVRLGIKLGTRYQPILDKIGEYQDGKTTDAKEMFYIDKSLAGVGGLEYTRLGYSGMEDFHPYAKEKLSRSKYHTRIYEILLEEEFKHINAFDQYFLLLKLAGDYEKFRLKMT